MGPISGGAGGQVEPGASGGSTSGGSVSPSTGGTLASTGGAPTASGGSSPAGGSSSGSSSGGLSGASGQTGGAGSEVGGNASGGSASGGSAGLGGSGSGGTPETGGVSAGGASTGGSAGAGAGAGGTAAGSGGQGGQNDCNLPATVSFQQDLQPFLIPSCGGGNGCHVIDNASTTANGGYNHAYDWITAGSHASSCPTTPFRFEIVIDVINEANPPSCGNSRKMPPPDGDDVRTPLTPCQVAALQAWLDEPTVVQTHRADDSSPTTPYAMPPFN